MSTVVQATEHVVVESATTVVSQVVNSTTGDLKASGSSAVQKVVSAIPEPTTSLLDKVQNDLTDVASEVVIGAEGAVDAVEQHPELIAEGALAVVIGAASVIQPELAGGEVALIGKMAADSAKKTVTTIASDTGSKVVKAISKDLTGDAKEEQAKESIDLAAREKTEAKADRKVIVEAPEPKNEPAKAVEVGSSSSSAEADIATDPDGATKTARSGPAARGTGPSNPEAEPANDTATKDKTIAIEVTQEPSKAVSNGDGTSPEAKTDSGPTAPVSLNITPGANGEVKAVTRSDVESKSIATIQIAEAKSNTSTTSIEKTTKTAMRAIKPRIEEDLVASKPSIPTAPTSNSEVNPPIAQTPHQVILDTSKKDEQVASKTAAVYSRPMFDKEPEIIQGKPQVVDSSHELVVSALVSAVGTATSTTETKTSSNATPQETIAITGGPKMVTVSQESLDLMHQKIDTMIEAIQRVTEMLALHMPKPGSDASRPSAVENVEAIINEALGTTIKPLTDLVPEILAKNDDSSHPPLETPSTPKSSPKDQLLRSGRVFSVQLERPFGSSVLRRR